MENGSKAPIAAWAQYQQQRPDEAQVTAWYGPRTGVGLICGAVSGNLELFEFDDIETYREYKECANSAGIGALVDTIETGYLEETPGNGIHWLYKCGEVAGNTKLARRPKFPEEMGHAKDNVKVLIETRGEGGFVIIAPSNGKVHPTGAPYKLLKGGVETIPTITPEQRESLWELAYSFDQMPKQEIIPPSTTTKTNGGRPGDDFNARATWQDILTPHGWTLVFMRGHVGHWRRPGKPDGISATTDYEDSNLFFVFSSSTEFDSPQAYSKFSTYAVLNHNGNHSDAAKALSIQGYGGSPPHADSGGGDPPKAPDSHYRETDVGNAKRLVAAHGGDIRYCFQWGGWLCWTGVRWERDNTGELPRRAKGVIDALFDQAVTMYRMAGDLEKLGEEERGVKLKIQADILWKHAKTSEGAARIAAMLEMGKSEPGIAVQPDEFDADPWLLCNKTGTIELRTGKSREHRREDLITMLSPVAFKPGAKLPLWDQFIADAIPDQETQAYVQRCVGATLVGQAIDDVLLVCHGPGGAGKGTFLNAIQQALGDYAAAADLGTFTTKGDAHGPQPDMARLKGIRMVAISEVTTGDSVALLKRASGGDPITTRNHHEKTFQFIPQFTIWIICNDRPRVPDSDTGIWRRMREIPFTIKFTNPDTSIRTKLTNPTISGSAVLAWAIEGCLIWQKEGLGQLPQQVAEATQAYRVDMDPIADWREDNIAEDDPSAWTAFKALFLDYQLWAKKEGIRYPIGRKTFGSKLGETFESKKGPGGTRGNLGLALKTANSGISEMPLTPGGPVDSHGNTPYVDKPGNDMPQMPLLDVAHAQNEMPQQAQNEMPEMPGNATDRMPWEENENEQS